MRYLAEYWLTAGFGRRAEQIAALVSQPVNLTGSCPTYPERDVRAVLDVSCDPEETNMRMIRVLTLLATAAVVFSASAKPSAAMVIYPWCAEYGGKMGGSENCGFVNFRQCLATITGNGGLV